LISFLSAAVGVSRSAVLRISSTPNGAAPSEYCPVRLA
jgi:hypothetical protein